MNNTGITKSSSGASSDGELVIIGAGICGLATAIALHRKGIKSLVFERSETLRNTTGTAILFRQNGMRALDQLGVAETLRHTAIPVQREREVWLVKGRQKEIPIDGESLCLRRKHLIDTLYAALPSGTVQFGRQLESIKLDLNTARHVLKLIEGSFNIAKVVIGCDGANSVVSCTLSHSLPIVHLRYRAPWDLLTDTFCKGTVTVAGDAMHVMSPFLGQGGSAGLEDAVVLARNMAQMGLDHNESGRKLATKCVGEAFELYVKQRRMRVFLLSFHGYLIGVLFGTPSRLRRLITIMVLALLFRNPYGHIHYDCGGL